MAGEPLPPDAARLRVVADTRPHKLSASSAQPTSPTATSPSRGRTASLSHFSRGDHAALKLDTWQPAGSASGGMAPAGDAAAASSSVHAETTAPPLLPNGTAHAASSSLGGSSDQASPRFLDMLRASLPSEADGELGGGFMLPGSAHDGGSELPSTLAALHALNGHSTAAGAAASHEASAAAGKKHKRSFLGLFKPSKPSRQLQKEQELLAASAAAVAAGSKNGSKKKGSQWFGGSKSQQSSPSAAAAAAHRPPLPQSPRLPAPAAAMEPQGSGVLLPGLPLHLAPSSDAGSSRGREDGNTSSVAGGSPAVLAGVSEGWAATITDASDVSMPSSALPSPAVGMLAGEPGLDAGGKKGGHRRHRSITSMLLPGWRRRSHASAGSESELGGDVTPSGAGSPTPPRSASPAPPRSAEGMAAATAAGAYACFGVSATQSADGEQLQRLPSLAMDPLPPLLPPGTTGLRNIGNTCFVNAALQCLRYTPGLPLHVAPDLLQRAEQQGQPVGQAAGSGPAAAGGEPAAGEDVHQQALARASVDVKSHAAALPVPHASMRGDEAASQAAGAGAADAAAADAAQPEGHSATVAADAAAHPVSHLEAVQEGDATDGEAAAAAAAVAEGLKVADGEAVPATGSATAETPLTQDGAANGGLSGGQRPADSAADAATVPAVDAPPTQQQQQQQQRPAAAPQKPPLPQRPARGELLKAFGELVCELYLAPSSGATVCANPLLNTLRAFPIAADYFDGGQHDCQEVLRVMMDLLHDDLNRVAPRPSSAATAPAVGQAAAALAPAPAAAAAPAVAQEDQAAAQVAVGSGESGAAEPPQQQQPAEGTFEQQPSGAVALPAALSAHDASVAEQHGEQHGEQQQQQQQQQVEHRQAASGPVHAAAGTEQQQQEGGPKNAVKQQEGAGEEADEQQNGGEEKADKQPPEDEAAKGDRLWQQYHERDSSVITDLFGGQLQSSVTCHKCGGRFTMYEPFWDLSLPLAKEAKGGTFSWLGLKGSSPSSIQDCLTAFTADEKMEGAEAFHCERCNEKTAATKHLRVHRFPEVLVLHIKRFKYRGASTDKLTANVAFPLKGLRLHQFASPECPAGPEECNYNLFAVSNHYGNLSGGHYTAMCRVPQAGGDETWYSFNDEQVARVSPNQVVSQYAYILFYVRSRASTAAHHRRNHSAASAGGQ